MKRIPLNITLILAISALLIWEDAKAAGEGGAADTTRETIEQLENEFHKAILDQDKATLNRLLSDDCTTGNDQVLTKTQHIDQIMNTNPPKSHTLDSISVKLYGDTAVVTGLSTTEWPSPANRSMDKSRWVNVWAHGEHGWQVVYIQSTRLGWPDDGC